MQKRQIFNRLFLYLRMFRWRNSYCCQRKNQDDQKVIAYLSGRGIDKEIIQFCLESGRVYESSFHHNAVFVGMDEKENPKYAAIRGIGTSFIGEANGSDKNYSFSIFTEKPQDTVHLFESAIDLLSYATLQKLEGKGVEKRTFIVIGRCLSTSKRN